MTFKEHRRILDALSSVADAEGVADIRKAAVEAGVDDKTIMQCCKTVGFRVVDSWHINTKIIDC